ncbi:MAG: type IV pilin protein [Syntrophales bacterium]
MFKKLRKGQKGFTLVELMIVIAIIGILAAIAIPQFGAYRERGFVSSMQADTSSLRTAQEGYFADKSAYTNATSDLTAYGFKGFSTGNGASFTTSATSFTVQVTSSKTSKTVTYDSAAGTTTTT